MNFNNLLPVDKFLKDLKLNIIFIVFYLNTTFNKY